MMDSNLFGGPAALSTIVAVCLALGWYIHQHTPHEAFPPGPRGLPIVGSMFDFDRKRPLAKLSEWHATYGEGIVESIPDGADSSPQASWSTSGYSVVVSWC